MAKVIQLPTGEPTPDEETELRRQVAQDRIMPMLQTASKWGGVSIYVTTIDHKAPGGQLVCGALGCDDEAVVQYMQGLAQKVRAAGSATPEFEKNVAQDVARPNCATLRTMIQGMQNTLDAMEKLGVDES